jgi:multidrug resistance efflux pump
LNISPKLKKELPAVIGIVVITAVILWIRAKKAGNSVAPLYSAGLNSAYNSLPVNGSYANSDAQSAANTAFSQQLQLQQAQNQAQLDAAKQASSAQIASIQAQTNAQTQLIQAQTNAAVKLHVEQNNMFAGCASNNVGPCLSGAIKAIPIIGNLLGGLF